MNTIRKIFEIGYLIIAVLCFYETYARWQSDRQKAYMFLGLAVLSIIMYFFKKRFRKKLDSVQNKSE
jgi:LPXTG-motif cell wall-anchored protein